MKLKALLLISVCTLALTACGPNLDDAQKLGFDTVEQMKKLQADGYKTMDEFNAAESKRLGFGDVAEMKKLQAEGFRTKFDWVESEAKRLNFQSIADYKDGFQNGFAEGKLYELKKQYGFKDYDLFLEYKNSNPAKRVDILSGNYLTIYTRQRAVECIGILAAYTQFMIDYKVNGQKGLLDNAPALIGSYTLILKKSGVDDSQLAPTMLESAQPVYDDLVKLMNDRNIGKNEFSSRFRVVSDKATECINESGKIFSETAILKY